MTAATLAGGRYVLEERLGSGGMGSVYLARDRELERPVAVKLLAEGLADDHEFRQRFVREARLAARLSHPNIVTVFDTGAEDGRPYIVMEYVDGETLADALRRRRFSVEEAVDLALQACAGLEHAHAAGLVHRDVKPGNLLLRDDGTLKVSDFGIARAAESSRLTEVGTVLGTAAYLAPEQARGEPVTPAADVYSLGAVLFELLTGEPPHRAASLEDLARRQAQAPPPLRDRLPDAPPALESALERALATAPDERQASAGELARDLVAGATASRRPTEPLTAAGVSRRATVPLPRRTRVVAAPGAERPPGRHRTERRLPVVLALAAAAVLLALVAAALLSDGGGNAARAPAEPARVEPPRTGATPEEEARNLAEWLRRYSQ